MVKKIVFERRLKNNSNSDLDRYRLLMQKLDTHFGHPGTSGSGGLSGLMGSSGSMGDPLRYSGEPGREIKIREELLKQREKEITQELKRVNKLRNDYPAFYSETTISGSTNLNGRIYPGNHLDEDYYKKWCGHTINDTQTIKVGDSRDTVNHNIQELTPEVKKHKINWKFWRK